MTISIAAARTVELEAVSHQDNPFFAWNNLAAGATLSGTPVLADGDAVNAVSGSTWDFWRPDVTATTCALSAEFASARTVSCAAIAAHNLADLGATVRVRASTDGISWSDAGAGAVTPTDNRPIIWRMVTSGQDRLHWQFYVTGLTIADPVAVGVAFLGDELVMPDRFFSGFSPVLTPTEVDLQSNVSQGGHLLGSSVVKRGSTLSLAFGHLPASFVRGPEWLGFQTAYNEGVPAFFGWRPEAYPSDAHYIWRQGPALRPTNIGVRDWMSITSSARVYES